MNKKNNGHLTGEQLFLRYAWSCALIRLDEGEMSQDDYDRLKHLIDDMGQPERLFLETCFPDAYSAYEKYLAERGTSGRLYEWSFESVADYWRHNHHHPDRPEGEKQDVHVAEFVESIIPIPFVNVRIDDCVIIAVNIYNLCLQTGDKVYMHDRTITEKLEESEK